MKKIIKKAVTILASLSIAASVFMPNLSFIGSSNTNNTVSAASCTGHVRYTDLTSSVIVTERSYSKNTCTEQKVRYTYAICSRCGAKLWLKSRTVLSTRKYSTLLDLT